MQCPFRTIDALDPQRQARAAARRPQRAGEGRRGSPTARASSACARPSRELADKGARVIVCSHFDRPKGKRVPEMSLQADGRGAVGRAAAARSPSPTTASARRPRPPSPRCRTARCCCSRTPASTPARRRTTRRWPQALAKLADVYVNDAFSAAHRAHASHRGRRASAAGLCRAADAGRARGAGCRARQPGAAGGRDRRRRQGLDQARPARQPDRARSTCW